MTNTLRKTFFSGVTALLLLLNACNIGGTLSGVSANEQTESAGRPLVPPPQTPPVIMPPVIVVNPPAAVCYGSSTRDCAISNGSGGQTAVCTDGEWSWLECAVKTCDSGFERSGNACVAAGSLIAPLILSPANNGTLDATNTVTVTWKASGQNGYLIRAKENIPGASPFVYNDAYTSTSVTFSVQAGKSYAFWIHTKGPNFDIYNSKTYSNEAAITFSIQQAPGCNSGYRQVGNTCVLIGGTSSLLMPSSINRRYFSTNAGTPQEKSVYLTGSHNWSNLLDLQFDYNNDYIPRLVALHHNFFRMWNGAHWGDAPPYFLRVGSHDGSLPLFNLSQFDQRYFDRLKSMVDTAGQNGIYVGFMFFEGVDTGYLNSSPDDVTYRNYSPFRAGNNVNGINLGPDDLKRSHIDTTGAIWDIQRAYVLKVLETLKDCDNVIYEVGNEMPPGSTNFQNAIVNLVQSTPEERHVVGISAAAGSGLSGLITNQDMYDSSAAWMSVGLNGGLGLFGFNSPDLRNNPPLITDSFIKPVFSDNDHFEPWVDPWGYDDASRILALAEWPWKSFTRGLNPIFLDTWKNTNFPISLEGILNASVRPTMGQTNIYAQKMDLLHMTPSVSDCSTGYCLRNPGMEYLVYQPSGGAGFSVALGAGSYAVEWFNPYTNEFTAQAAVSGGTQNFSAPSGSWNFGSVLYLKKN